MAAGACCSHSARKVVTGTVIACEFLPNSLCGFQRVAFHRGREAMEILDEVVGRLAGLFPDQ